MRGLIVIFLFCFACNSKQGDKAAPNAINPDTTAHKRNNTDSVIISERIDGPANVRDTVNGNLIFSLNDNCAVTATQPKDGWLQVGIIADISQEQFDSLRIQRGSRLFVDGHEIGKALENFHLNGAFKTNEGLKGEVVGYTSTSNIRPNTIPENAFTKIINSTNGTLTIDNFKKFLKDFQFNDFDSLLSGFKAFEIDENWIDDPSPLLRLWILFQGDKFYGVFHSRNLYIKDIKTVHVKRGFYFSTFSQNDKINKELISAFNSFIVQVD